MKLTQHIPSLLVAAVCAIGASSASAIALPSSNVMSTTTYGDFQVYSLDLLEQCAAAGDSRCLPSNMPISANSGYTKTQLTVFTGENGAPQTTNQPDPLADGALADNAFVSPSGNQSGTLKFGTGLSVEPTPTFTGDRSGYWDITIGTLRSYLGTNDLVFIFDNAQEGDAANQWLQIWGQAQIVDTAGAMKGCFEINSSSVGGCSSSAPVAPTQAFDPFSPYVTAYTGYCVDKVSGASFDLGLGSASYCAGKNAYYVNGNIGSANADNAAFSKALNDFVFASTTDANWILSLDIRTANNNGGAETLWICETCKIDVPRTDVPEPGSLALVALGLLGLAAKRRRAN